MYIVKSKITNNWAFSLFNKIIQLNNKS
jgi:hypothetical protein